MGHVNDLLNGYDNLNKTTYVLARKWVNLLIWRLCRIGEPFESHLLSRFRGTGVSESQVLQNSVEVHHENTDFEISERFEVREDMF